MTATPLRQTDQRRLDQFRSFYDLLIGLRDQLKAATAETLPPELGREAIQQRLQDKLQELGYAPAPDNPTAVVDPGYVMAAMADEVMLMDWGNWRDRGAWADQPLERRLYGTRLAGDRVFEAADRLVAGLRDETGTAILILTCVLLGFRGGYRTAGGETDRQVVILRDKLYAHVYGKPWSPGELAPVEPAAAPLTGRSVRKLPRLWPWLAAIAAVVILYLPVSHVVWRWHVRNVDKVANHISGAPDRPPAGEVRR